ncbi:hypothetical protein Murru_1464 [Allomuricauda ruestringensis DSM 13258]|uniref:Outer membrane protein beta-barrel domain-containing protein n=1 Tax=Allomuricauda ruestringensis (strain DSM 13258 / CIP 107369 / LMG 19739 / B1) TaxID=886377 RepID=G2PQ40_ALLRU|nr:porin family protein [Allomuricauda ruestringensis]AEM70505.1 hypothetical protein Murru_1464 [Allomuricauda ruestringensis DSM 13258]
MKKSVSVVVIVLLASSLFVNAQERNFGVVGGINYGNIRGDRAESINSSWRLAYHFGIFSNISLSDRIALEPRILFSSKGYDDEIDFDELNFAPIDGPTIPQNRVNYTSRNNYLSVPVLLKYKLVNNLSLDLGPEIAFLLHSKDIITKVDREGFYAKGDVPNEGSGDFFLDYGAMAGVTYYFTDDASIQLNYFHGLSNLHRKNPIGDSTENNSVIQLSLGYLIF